MIHFSNLAPRSLLPSIEPLLTGLAELGSVHLLHKHLHHPRQELSEELLLRASCQARCKVSEGASVATNGDGTGGGGRERAARSRAALPASTRLLSISAPGRAPPVNQNAGPGGVPSARLVRRRVNHPAMGGDAADWPWCW